MLIKFNSSKLWVDYTTKEISQKPQLLIGKIIPEIKIMYLGRFYKVKITEYEEINQGLIYKLVAPEELNSSPKFDLKFKVFLPKDLISDKILVTIDYLSRLITEDIK